VKDRNFQIFHFFEFWNCLVTKVRKFFGKTGFSEFAKIHKKKFGSKTPVLGSKTGVSEHSEFTEYSKFVLFRIFQKLQKNDVKIEFRLEYSSSSSVCRALWEKKTKRSITGQAVTTITAMQARIPNLDKNTHFG